MGSVDVVVPSYQYGHVLNECLTSVLTQDIEELRLLVIDNASTDDSVEVALRLAAKDSRIEVVARRTNLGPHASFNEGIDWARSDYFLVVCADDLLAPGALRRATAVMDRHPGVHLAYGASLSVPSSGFPTMPELVDHDGPWRILPGKRLIETFCATGRNHIPGPTALVRTSVQKEVGYYRAELRHTDDFEMWMRLACRGSVAETDAIQGLARTHPVNQSASVPNIHAWDLEYEAAFASFFANEGRTFPNAERLLRAARRSLGGRAYWCALSHLCRGEHRTAADLLRFAWRVRPTTVLLPPIDHLYRRPDARDRIVRALSNAGERLLKRHARAC